MCTPSVENVQALEDSLKTSIEQGSSLNSLSSLVRIAIDANTSAVAHKSIWALYRLFYQLISEHHGHSAKVEARAVRLWLHERMDDYIQLLCGLLKDEEARLRVDSLNILLSLVKCFSERDSMAHSVPSQLRIVTRVTKALLLCPASIRAHHQKNSTPSHLVDNDVKEVFVHDWLNAFDDVRWVFFKKSMLMFKSETSGPVKMIMSWNLLALLEKIDALPTTADELGRFCMFPNTKHANPETYNGTQEDPDEDWGLFFETLEEGQHEKRVSRHLKTSVRDSIESLASHRAVFSACWLFLLPQLPMSSALSTRALSILHAVAIPHVDQPLRFMDWIASCVDQGGATGLLALNTLYQLIVRHNIDYPDFYRRLYGFIDQELLHSKHRSRFFRLVEAFLSSSHLPAVLLASFVKRLSRLSLRASPAALVLIIPFAYNVLKRHPVLMVMIHNPVHNFGDDPYNSVQESPLLTHALQSSLWELNSHRHHYLASVSTMAEILSQPMTKVAYDLDDFSDHSATTIFENETSQQIKHPLIFGLDVVGGSDNPMVAHWQLSTP